MDKRTIYGIILIAAILILMPIWQKWVIGTVEQGQAQAGDSLHVAGQHELTPHPDTLTTPPELTARESLAEPAQHADSAITDSLISKIPIEEIEIHTDKFDIILTTLGGDITSIKLADIYDSRGQRVELAPRLLEGPNCEFIITMGQKSLSSAGVRFQADRKSITIDENNPRDAVTMVGVLHDGSMIQRRYEFEFDTYHITHKIFVAGKDSTLLFDDAILWWKGGLVPTEKNIGWDIREIVVRYRFGDGIEKVKPSSKRPSTADDGSTDWAGITSKYFTVILMPDKTFAASGVRTSVFWQRDTAFTKEIPVMQFGLYHRIRETKFTGSYLIYAGPRDHFIIKEYGRMLDKIVDLGWSWLSPISKVLLGMFRFMNKAIPNYGWMIVIFTILMKVLLLPIATKQLKSMKKMRTVQPQIRSLQERYREDPKKLQSETMKLYKKHGVSPLSGWLPLLVQMPVFFALYRALSGGFQFRGQPFIFWIKDLSQQDPYFVLPILMGITMFVQQKISISDPKQKAMMYIMPVIFMFFFYKLPAGLVLYWTVFNILSVMHMLWVEHTWSDLPIEPLVIPVKAETDKKKQQ